MLVGADGGVVYCKLKNNGKDYDHLIELIKPFYLWLSSEDWFREDACGIWEKENSEICAPKYLLNYYGTHRDYSLINLIEILQDDPICSDDSLTFSELIEDLSTRPFLDMNGSYKYLGPRQYSMYEFYSFCWYHTEITTLEKLVWSEFGSRFEGPLKSDFKDELFIPIKNMVIKDWANELRSILDLNSINHEETWT